MPAGVAIMRAGRADMAQETKRAGLGLLNGSQAPGDFWGGLAAMLVVLPASIAFGVTVYSAIG